ncbi:hypothetical protein AB0K34_29345, partial [Actinomadura sp. NPDC049382]|uniref:hypothetical protein n=1 Tax=Actinomadura sp. NPDC049382 TaxID=3158220 RepID=UPI003444478D
MIISASPPRQVFPSENAHNPRPATSSPASAATASSPAATSAAPARRRGGQPQRRLHDAAPLHELGDLLGGVALAGAVRA